MNVSRQAHALEDDGLYADYLKRHEHPLANVWLQELRMLLERKSHPLTLHFNWEDGGKFKNEMVREDDVDDEDDGADMFPLADEADAAEEADADLYCVMKKGNFITVTRCTCQLFKTSLSQSETSI
jgi:hypothetical protein